MQPIPKDLKEKILLLVYNYPADMSVSEFQNLYRIRYGEKIQFEDLGYSKISNLLSQIYELKLQAKGDSSVYISVKPDVQIRRNTSEYMYKEPIEETGLSIEQYRRFKDTPVELRQLCDPSSGGGCFLCSICTTLARRPLLSSCGHLFCKVCITDWRETDVRLSGGYRMERYFLCPSCKEALPYDKSLHPICPKAKGTRRDMWNLLASLKLRCVVEVCTWSGTYGTWLKHVPCCKLQKTKDRVQTKDRVPELSSDRLFAALTSAGVHNVNRRVQELTKTMRRKYMPRVQQFYTECIAASSIEERRRFEYCMDTLVPTDRRIDPFPFHLDGFKMSDELRIPQRTHEMCDAVRRIRHCELLPPIFDEATDSC